MQLFIIFFVFFHDSPFFFHLLFVPLHRFFEHIYQKRVENEAEKRQTTRSSSPPCTCDGELSKMNYSI